MTERLPKPGSEPNKQTPQSLAVSQREDGVSLVCGNRGQPEPSQNAKD